MLIKNVVIRLDLIVKVVMLVIINFLFFIFFPMNLVISAFGPLCRRNIGTYRNVHMPIL